LEIAVHKEGKNGYSLTYVDQEFRTAITGKDLGEGYTASTILKEIPGVDLSNQLLQAQKSGFSFKAPQLLSAIINPEPPDENQFQIKQKL
jgi:hypothetical protein